MKTRILYVEDEPALGRIVKESLESRDFEVKLVTDGRDAVDAFRQHNPELCVLDIMMPSKDGYSIAQDIRQLSPSTPIIFLTAKTQTEDLLKGFASGGNDYIRKPFSMEELIVRIQNLLQLMGQQQSQGKKEVTIGRFRFNLERGELILNDKVRRLSERETSLLSVLTENMNGTTRRKDILMRVWGDDTFFNSRNLDVYIMRLREHLREDPSIELITIKNVGYLLSENSPTPPKS